MSFTTTLKKALDHSTRTYVNGCDIDTHLRVAGGVAIFRSARIPLDTEISIEHEGYCQLEVDGKDELIEFQFFVERGLEPRDVGQIKTNEDLIAELMANPNAMYQMLIVEAIQRYADACAKADPKDFEGSMVHGPAWIKCAQDIKERMNKFYSRHKE